jgi:hypothetical protein
VWLPVPITRERPGKASYFQYLTVMRRECRDAKF